MGGLQPLAGIAAMLAMLPAALWITVAAVMLLFAGAALMTREAWRLLPLLMPWLLLLGLLAVLWERSGAGEGAVADSGAWVVLHILVSVATYALLTLAAVAGLAVMLQERALKARKRPTRLTHSLPSVADCEALQIRLLTASAVVLAIGVLTGMASGWVVRGSLLSFDHKTLLVLAGLVVICLLLWAHHRTGLRGRRAARIVLLAWGLLTLGWLGVKFVTDVLIG